MLVLRSPLYDAPTEPLELLRWALATWRRPALATSLGPQSLVILHLLQKLSAEVRVLLLDTGLLFPETLEQIARVEARFGVRIERITPERTVEQQASDEGPELWARSPDRCCMLRKVLPLQRALTGHDVWIAGLRRDQGPSRAQIRTVSWDTRHGMVKLSPLAHWSASQVRDYVAAHDLPVNALLSRGYPSVGCWPCTAPSSEGERDGRWAGQEKTECGIHLPEGVTR